MKQSLRLSISSVLALSALLNVPCHAGDGKTGSGISLPACRDYAYEIYGKGLPGFYRAHKAAMEKDPCMRELNGAMALVFLQLFEERPERWEAVRWLNSSPAPQGETFTAFLQRWHDAPPSRCQSFVKKVADLFGVAIRSNAPAEPAASARSAAAPGSLSPNP